MPCKAKARANKRPFWTEVVPAPALGCTLKLQGEMRSGKREQILVADVAFEGQRPQVKTLGAAHNAHAHEASGFEGLH